MFFGLDPFPAVRGASLKCSLMAARAFEESTKKGLKLDADPTRYQLGGQVTQIMDYDIFWSFDIFCLISWRSIQETYLGFNASASRARFQSPPSTLAGCQPHLLLPSVCFLPLSYWPAVALHDINDLHWYHSHTLWILDGLPSLIESQSWFYRLLAKKFDAELASGVTHPRSPQANAPCAKLALG